MMLTDAQQRMIAELRHALGTTSLTVGVNGMTTANGDDIGVWFSDDDDLVLVTFGKRRGPKTTAAVLRDIQA
jgi:hypothetical protein